MTEDRGQMTDDRGQRTEDRNQKSEDSGLMRWEGGRVKDVKKLIADSS
jgi:hypothetical protein